MPRSDKKRTLRPKSINKSNNDLNFDRGPDSNHILSLQNSPRAGSRIENLFIPDIQSTAQLIVEKTKNKRYKKQDIMNKCSRLKVRFDEGRNDVSPMRSLDRSRRFLSSSEIKESAENYLLESSISNQKCLEKLGKYTSPANKGQHPRFSPDLDLYKSMKPSVILKRNLYKLNKQLE
uniref:Uncharacterized protein n=1 Tax=Euplotes crassus TaxID=5936 RepID=A0A7S3NTK1_EUPCR|mmetsp:Transcript_18908/g.18570  ORF Transcript_18908/g.18570 Transcript_18908/m.18570 type:complete len:177 (+) Transcript_18908:512-1042(+)